MMKYQSKKNIVLILAGILSLPASAPAFASEALSAEKQGVQAPVVTELTKEEREALALPQLTYEEALAKAIKHSPDLRDIEDMLDYLEEAEEDLYDRYGSIKIPTYEYKRWASDGWHGLVSASYQMESGTKQAKLRKEIQKKALEISVKSFFVSIKNNQDTLELVKRRAKVQKDLYEQGKMKHRLGLMSKYNLEQMEVTVQQAQDTVDLLEDTLEQTYIKFNSLIGEKADSRFEYMYDVTFEPYEMAQTLEQYINSALKNDLAIQVQELLVEDMKFTANYRAYSDTDSSYDKDKLDYDTEKRTLKTAKEDKETLIRNAYLQIRQLETSYASAKADLESAESDYKALQANFLAGNMNKTAVEQAELGVISAQNALNEIVYNHDMQIFAFENTELLSESK